MQNNEMDQVDGERSHARTRSILEEKIHRTAVNFIVSHYSFECKNVVGCFRLASSPSPTQQLGTKLVEMESGKKRRKWSRRRKVVCTLSPYERQHENRKTTYVKLLVVL